MRRVIKAIKLKKIVVFGLVGLFIIAMIIFAIITIRGHYNKEVKPISNFVIKPTDINLNKKNVGTIKVKVYLTKQNKIQEMDLEEYIIGVVFAEMPAEFSIEALKAQAVAARTFAAAHMECFGGVKYANAKGADLLDTVQCQVFITKEEREEKWTKNKSKECCDKVAQAVRETTGQILVYDGKLVKEPYYFAVSSGRTENAEEVFDGKQPYLKSVESRGEEIAPKYKSNIKISSDKFVNKVNNAYKGTSLNKSNLISKVNIIERNQGGSVKLIRLGNTTISGVKFRSLMGLNSANFSIKIQADNVEIYCNGYGHGVGMSQWGANAMAKDGRNYRQILEHYYQGVDIVASDQLLVSSN